MLESRCDGGGCCCLWPCRCGYGTMVPKRTAEGLPAGHVADGPPSSSTKAVAEKADPKTEAEAARLEDEEEEQEDAQEEGIDGVNTTCNSKEAEALVGGGGESLLGAAWRRAWRSGHEAGCFDCWR